MVHPEGGDTRDETRMAVRMTRLYLVRHGRAAAGWDTDPDPGLDEIGQRQADDVAARLAPLGPLRILTSPLRRCRETSAGLAQAWHVEAEVATAVAEIPSPEGVAMADRIEWLRVAMRGTWSELGPRYVNFRDGVVGALSHSRERFRRLQSFRRHQRCNRRCNRRRSAGGTQSRQLLGDGRRRR